ncbi:amylase cluster transcriptional regulator AmyR [Fusarium austroafricanum]|uniref:Amylase cluster transcriptional regulator AmyR n=1 Tax=Fusarium austroafricanum TaxID=2364996 RepID=A0A8H4P638_9HYPO|nr:amylase cluster transcriptional regulator AmyR [Fusarium austroafricanum]
MAPARRGRPPVGERRKRSQKERISTSPGSAAPESSESPSSSYVSDDTISLPADSAFPPEMFQDYNLSDPPEPWQQIIEYPPNSAGLVSNPIDAPNPQQLVAQSQYPLSAYTHWTRIFLMRLYPVFPVINPGCLLSKLSLTKDTVSRSVARFFAAMSAAVIVQLNLDAGHQGAPSSLADRYIAQCIAERQESMAFIEEADEWTILESFFIFSYHGNRNKSKMAWYYLREAIGFALSMGLDREESYKGPDLETNERQRLTYWLLFITERAYCLQHQTSPILRPSIGLPQIYEGCDEATLRGFIDLIKLFILADSAFVASWCAQTINGDNKTVTMLSNPERFASHNTSAIDETQKADISVTQCWLHTLSWQMRSHANSPGQASAAISLRRAARSLVSCFSNTPRDAIEAHGIGMEQKVSDIAGFMCDLLPTVEHTADIDSIPNLLHNLMCLLANFRNQESGYLGPLAERATALLMVHSGGPNYLPCLEDVGDDEDEWWEDSRKD